MKMNINDKSCNLENSKSKVNQIQRKLQNQKTKEDKIFDIRERTFQFSLRIIEITNDLPRTLPFNIIKTQLIKSGTSIGANIEEADGSISKRDFLNKAVIARKEAKETKYWLRIIASQEFNIDNLKNDLDEIQEIINILSVMINKTRNKKH
jgi:four helix bundle protein